MILIQKKSKKWNCKKYVYLTLILSMTFIGFCFTSLSFSEAVNRVNLTDEEIQYIANRGVIKLVVDPDWYPYEKIDEKGQYIGISSDLIDLIAQRTGLNFELVPTVNWDETIAFAKSGQADLVSLLNQTDERDKWLLFTDPYFEDPNVLITRDEHDYVSNLARLTDETIVLPSGTSVEERLKKDYPNISIMIVDNETQAIQFVDRKKADMTLRSLTMVAYIINKEGYFNLKIAGEVPEYKNYLRMGVTKNDEVLLSILNKGIATITAQEVQSIINKHIALKVINGVDYKIFAIVSTAFAIILIVILYWTRKYQNLNKKLMLRHQELFELGEKISESERSYRKLAEELEVKNILLEASANTDSMTQLKNRNFFNALVTREMTNLENVHKLSMVIIDLDHFKRINDTYGHNEGDQVIIKFANVLSSSLKATDLMARWGGEEFIILLKDADLQEAKLVAERLREIAEGIQHINKEIITISLGVSTLSENENFEHWFKRTDEALYKAKQSGRNNVYISKV